MVIMLECRWEYFEAGVIVWNEDGTIESYTPPTPVLVCHGRVMDIGNPLFASVTPNGTGDSGGGMMIGGSAPWQGSGGGRAGECARLVANMERVLKALDAKLAKYDPVADYWGGQTYRYGPGQFGITVPESHYKIINRLQDRIRRFINTWKSLCNNNFGDPPLMPLPEGIERRLEPVTPPHPGDLFKLSPFPTERQWRKIQRQYPYGPPVPIPMPVPLPVW